MSYSRADAEKAGWQIALESEPETIEAPGTAGQIEVTVQPGRYTAEKTQDGHLISAAGHTEEQLLAAIESQQASLDAAAQPGPGPAPVSVDAGGENAGIGGALPDTKVETPEEVAP